MVHVSLFLNFPSDGQPPFEQHLDNAFLRLFPERFDILSKWQQLRNNSLPRPFRCTSVCIPVRPVFDELVQREQVFRADSRQQAVVRGVGKEAADTAGSANTGRVVSLATALTRH